MIQEKKVYYYNVDCQQYAQEAEGCYCCWQT
jgi:hypothetical protein